LHHVQRLEAWKVAIELVEFVYRSTKGFPRDEIYGLTSQMRRAAVSVPANIAEGHGRDSTREYLHHVSFAMGSLAELETHIVIAGKFGYVAKREHDELTEACDKLGRILRGLQKSLKQKLRRPNL
jgi:four helix bundle protein